MLLTFNKHELSVTLSNVFDIRIKLHHSLSKLSLKSLTFKILQTTCASRIDIDWFMVVSPSLPLLQRTIVVNKHPVTGGNSNRYLPCCIDYIVYRSLITYRLWSPMLKLVYDNINLYNLSESAEITYLRQPL